METQTQTQAEAENPPPPPAAAPAAKGVAASGNAAKESAAFWSVVASGVLALGKLAAGLLSGSLALLSEAAHALADTGATIVTLFAVRHAGRPADEEHQYGHGKIESVAALVETGVLFALALAVLARAAWQLFHGGDAPVHVSALVVGVVLASIAVDLNRIRILRRVARETGSQALAADALHFASDMAGSLAVLAGLLAASFGVPFADTFAAAAVAAFIGAAGWRLGKRALDTLLDAAPPGRTQRLRAIVKTTTGVLDVESARVRSDGSKVFAEVIFATPRSFSLGEAADIKERVRQAVAAEYPDTELTLVANPRAPNFETVRERVLLAGQARRLPLHHVTVQELGKKLSISFDMEVDGKMTLRDAHTLAEDFKRGLRGEFGSAAEIEPHVEPLDAGPLAGRDAPHEETARVQALLVAGAARRKLVGEIHDVRVRETQAGRIVNYHCRAAGDLSVEAVHAEMDDIEHELRDTLRGQTLIARIVGHADVARH
ncbi:MAG: cation diffusion facilitator family transporter [Puniceicoccales bacterium]|jgi:cation diffusion facilitator family transporter|nr:cation diffusion facilitator family transporter [Puniceicoccales bacterium]